MNETEKDLKAFRNLLKMSPLFDLLGNFFEVLTNPDKYDAMFRELQEAHAQLDVVVSAVGPAKEISAMHAQTVLERDESRELLTSSKALTTKLKDEAESARITIIRKASEDAKEMRADAAERGDAMRTTTQAFVDKANATVKAADARIEARKKEVKTREDQVMRERDKVLSGREALDKGETALQSRLNHLDAAFAAAQAGKV